MFGSKKNTKSTSANPKKNLSQYGLFDMSADFNPETGVMNGGADDDNDSDLEAELAALAGGGSSMPKAPPRKKQIPSADLDAMVADSMKDLPSDEDLSGDDEDPELLNELNNIAGAEAADVESEPSTPASTSSTHQASDTVNMLDNRLKMYEEAEQNAKLSGESSRARRFTRGIKTIKDLLKQAKAGKTINMDDVPPEVSIGGKKPVESNDALEPTRVAPPIPIDATEQGTTEDEQVDSTEAAEVEPIHNVDPDLIKMLNERKNQYKFAALKAKKAGDKATAVSYIKIAKQFETVISAAESGQEIDLSKMPAAPIERRQEIEENEVQTDSVPVDTTEGETSQETLVTATSVGEALEQRLLVYQKQEESAKQEGNSSKARRMGRIVKQYEQAIKANNAGKPIPVDDLPTPPGYAPLPTGNHEVQPTSTPSAEKHEPNKVEMPDKPTPPKAQPSTSHTTRITGNQAPNSRAEKQLQLLLSKQKLFKEAALNAKRKGEIEQAKEYLRTAKGFEPLINAASCGLPVDLSTLPVSPTAKSHLDNEYDIVMAEECTEDDNSNTDILSRLENQLTKQLKMCLTTRDHNKALGDVAGTNRFERLALNVTRDLDVVRLARRNNGSTVPKFHYENRDFAIVKSFTEIGENDLELTIVRGISYACANPKEIDTYVKFDFPYPQDIPYSQRTATIKDTNSPQYDSMYTIPIQRTARVCQRVFKRHSVKFEVYSKGGFFRGDLLLGTATVKLQPLETNCELHDSFDLLEGRKKIGGKLEIKMRLRHPIVSEEVEQLHEKWLVIDS